jgi:hypothetical protein
MHLARSRFERSLISISPPFGPVSAWRRSSPFRPLPKHVVRHLDIGVAEIFRRLRSVADLGQVVADIACREDCIELHGGTPCG